MLVFRLIIIAVNDADFHAIVFVLPFSKPPAMTVALFVAIARFTNESIYGSGLFTDASGDRLGKQAADLLSRHLMATQRFNIVERRDIGKLKAEAELMGLSEAQFKRGYYVFPVY